MPSARYRYSKELQQILSANYFNLPAIIFKDCSYKKTKAPTEYRSFLTKIIFD